MSRLTPAGRATAAFVEAHGTTVLHGPFAGMAYPDRAVGRADFLAAKLLGTYELELHEALEQVIVAGSPHVVDVGSADGYYAVGLALRMPPSTRLVAYELDSGGRRLAQEMARLNGVEERLAFKGFCDPGRLAQTLSEGGVLLCDCEGYENALLRPERVPSLRSATVLVELHPMYVPEIEREVRDRFAESHDVRLFPMRRREPARWPELGSLSAQNAYLAVSEGWKSDEDWALPAFQRCWAFMTPRA